LIKEEKEAAKVNIGSNKVQEKYSRKKSFKKNSKSMPKCFSSRFKTAERGMKEFSISRVKKEKRYKLPG